MVSLSVTWQEWAVALVLLLCVVRLLRGLRRFFIRSQQGEGACTGCSSCPSCGGKAPSRHHPHGHKGQPTAYCQGGGHGLSCEEEAPTPKSESDANYQQPKPASEQTSPLACPATPDERPRSCCCQKKSASELEG